MPNDVKAQPVRIADVLIVGPVMVAGGVTLVTKGNPVLGGFLALLGVATVGYNARNYALVERQRRQLKP